MRKSLSALTLLLFFSKSTILSAEPPLSRSGLQPTLGIGDQVAVRVADLPELQLSGQNAPRIDDAGVLNLPVVGPVVARGLTIPQLEQQIASRLTSVLQHPTATAEIVQHRSYPVSVVGAVRTPGVVQVREQKSLLEVLSLAGGLNQDAGDTVTITRKRKNEQGGLAALSSRLADDSIVASISLKNLMEARNPDLNVEILSGDVITVPKAQMVYVLGAVKHAGGFPLHEREQMSVMQALSLAEGLDRAASLKGVRLLREQKPGQGFSKLTVDLKSVLAGRAPDVALQANDVLFIPASGTKLAAMRSVEAAIQLGTGAAIFR